MTNGEKALMAIIRQYGNNIRIAFINYKREMWNCMDSIYEAARSFGIAASIINIGYRYKFADHYQADAMPTEFYPEDYDIAIINYPYDDNNTLTGLNPAFYTASLHDYGLKIVYVPYFGYGCSNNTANQPGAKAADMIILDRESDKDPYLAAGIPEDRLMVTGAPKTDAIQKAKANMNICCIALSLMPTINNFSYTITKTRALIERLVGTGSTVIFRAHPLLIGGITQYKADKLVEWTNFIEEVRDCCLMDETPTPERTLAISNRVYLNGGSLADMCKAGNIEYEII